MEEEGVRESVHIANEWKLWKKTHILELVYHDYSAGVFSLQLLKPLTMSMKVHLVRVH
jgi:hypothetical protein